MHPSNVIDSLVCQALCSLLTQGGRAEQSASNAFLVLGSVHARKRGHKKLGLVSLDITGIGLCAGSARTYIMAGLARRLGLKYAQEDFVRN